MNRERGGVDREGGRWKSGVGETRVEEGGEMVDILKNEKNN